MWQATSYMFLAHIPLPILQPTYEVLSHKHLQMTNLRHRGVKIDPTLISPC